MQSRQRLLSIRAFRLGGIPSEQQNKIIEGFVVPGELLEPKGVLLRGPEPVGVDLRRNQEGQDGLLVSPPCDRRLKIEGGLHKAALPRQRSAGGLGVCNQRVPRGSALGFRVRMGAG
jgi:hypothetical protein